MALILAMAAGVAITKIICETLDKANERGQRYRLTLRRKGKDKFGQEYEEEMTFEFATEEEMMRQADRCKAISNAPIEKMITAN
jgi:sulfite reductase beta subunit-like hemoprotein